ncbi:MAG: S-layer homology domain-containing protein [Pseudoflavonifractor sp.]
MKKRVMSMLLVLCMVFSMAPTMALAAKKTEVDKRTIEMKVKERKKYDGPAATSFASSNQDVVTIYQDGEIVARQAGTGSVYAYNGGKTVAAWKIVVAGGKPAPRPENTGGWPFVPSPDNKTNGYIHSGWYQIFTHDGGMWHVNEDGMVTPTRRIQYVFYIEHLGNDVYYIYDPTGKYLSFKGDVKQRTQVMMSKTPKKWRVLENFDVQKKYVFSPVENDKFSIFTYGLCSETTDSMVKLNEQVDSTFYKLEYTIQGEGLEHYIPQWYKDFENGLSKPSTTDVTAQKVFGDAPDALKYTTKQEWDVLRQTNLQRAEAGLPMLVTTDAMQKVAGVRSDELITIFSHTRPDGTKPFTVFNTVGIQYQLAAENIAEGQSTPVAVVTDWMNSPGHRANILTEGLRYMGTGMSFGSMSEWVQIFATTANSDCKSISFDRELGYFTLQLHNGATAYAPYCKETPIQPHESVTFNYPGVQTIEGGAGNPAEKPVEKPPEYNPKDDGWYYMRLMGNYINASIDGGEDRYQLNDFEKNMRVFPEVVGDGIITLKTSDDEYFGLDSGRRNGDFACPTEEPYRWAIYKERGDDVFSLRPADSKKMLLNASGEKKADGTLLIIWKYENLDAPAHAEIQFVPVNPPKRNHPFTDVKAGGYYEEAVVWALNNKVTSGTSATTFAPDATCTRGEVVTFLWRAKGSPAPKSASNPFTDVKPSDYFYQPVLWAVENGITSGTSASTFHPTGTCSSGQVVTFLWRASGSPSKTGQGEYYADAVNWGNANGLLSGTATPFAPTNNSPRADIVTYLYRNSKK